MSELPSPQKPGEVTQLFALAREGDKPSQEKLFRMIEPMARMTALHWLRRYTALDRIRVTDLIDEAFVRLVPPPAAQGILAEAVRRNDTILGPLAEAGGNPDKIAKVIGDALSNERTSHQILESGSDLSDVQNAVRNLLSSEQAQRVLQDSVGSPEKVRDVLADLLRNRLVVDQSATQTPWPHRGRFYAFLCRIVWQVLIDMLRAGGGFTNSKVIPDLLAEALQGDDAILNQLAESGGDLKRIIKSFSDLIWGDRTARRILAEGGDPSRVQHAIQDLLNRADTQQTLRDAGDDPAKARDVLVDLVRSEAARKRLAVHRSIPQEDPAEGVEVAFGAGLAGVAQPAKGLTRHSVLALHQALEELDEVFADKPALPDAGKPDGAIERSVSGSLADKPADAAAPRLGLPERRSSHGQIIDLKLIAGFTWREIAERLELPRGTVESRAKVAVEYLKERLGGAFAEVFKEVQPPNA